MAIKNLVPRNHKEGKLGVESKKWKEVHAETGSFERIEGTFSISTGSLTIDGDISASGTISASVIYAQEGYFSASTVWIGDERLGETLITDLKAGKLPGWDLTDLKSGKALYDSERNPSRYTFTGRVQDIIQADNYMHLASDDRIYFSVGGKTIFDLDTGNNTIFLGKESGLGSIHPTVSASGDLWLSGSLNVNGTIGGNNIQGGAFETDGLGDIMPTSEIIFTDIYYEVDANDDLMPRL